MSAPDANSVQTEQFQRIQRIAQLTLDNKKMGAIWGPPGVGKTHGCELLARHYPKPLDWIVVPPRGSEKQVVRETLKAITGREYDLQTDRMKGMVEDLLPEHPRLVYDEADALDNLAFETIRRWRDASKGTLAVLFVGGTKAWTVLTRQDRLASRILYKCHVYPLRKPETREVLPLFHIMYEGMSEQLFELLWGRLKGNFRKIDYFTEVAHDLMREAGTAELSIKIAQAAFHLIDVEFADAARRSRRKVA